MDIKINEDDLITVFVVNCRNGNQANGVFTDYERAKRYAGDAGIMPLGKRELKDILIAQGFEINESKQDDL